MLSLQPDNQNQIYDIEFHNVDNILSLCALALGIDDISFEMLFISLSLLRLNCQCIKKGHLLHFAIF